MDEVKKQCILKYMSDPLHKDELINITAEPFVNAYVDEFGLVVCLRSS